MPIERDLAGHIIPAGRTTKTLIEPFMPGGALPSWLAMAPGTASYGTSAGSLGWVRGTTAATAGQTAVLSTTFDLSADQWEEIVWTLESLFFGVDDGYDVKIGVHGSSRTRGVDFVHPNNQDQPSIVAFNGAGNVTSPVGYLLKGDSGGSRRTRNISFRWRPKTGEAFIVQDDQVMASADVSAAVLTGGYVRPKIEIVAQTATAYYFQVHQIRLDLISS